MSKPKQSTNVIVNRRARYDYHLGDEFVLGIVLSGAEVRALREGRGHLKGAFATFKDGELWLNNMSISVRLSEPGGSQTVVNTGPRKLLAHKKELEKLQAAKQDGLTIVPVKVLAGGKFIKAVVAVAKGKKTIDKRETIKRREQTRDARRQLKRA